MNPYHEKSRELQDRFDTRRLADRLAEKLSRTAFSAEDKAFVESSPMFFLATADADGQPDCSYKGGVPGFVRITGASELSFASYDGNGMFRSLGNVLANPRVGLLFLDFEKPRRLRVLGRARLEEPRGEFDGEQLVVRVHAEQIFPNCPRYIHRTDGAVLSPDVPQPGHEPPVPAWKSMPFIVDVLPTR
jgi:predicted pyridoxine 5'-phosphate oxidase superfamily flavin-nucleotide-binding protein